TGITSADFPENACKPVGAGIDTGLWTRQVTQPCVGTAFHEAFAVCTAVGNRPVRGLPECPYGSITAARRRRGAQRRAAGCLAFPAQCERAATTGFRQR